MATPSYKTPFLIPLLRQIVSSTTPCADFFFRCCPSDPVKKEGRAGGLSHPSSRTTGGHWTWGGGPIEAVVRTCNELDLNIIVLWKVQSWYHP